MFDFANNDFRYEPYPICYAEDVFPADQYKELCHQFPPKDLFEYKPRLGKKYSLSERNNGRKYRNFIAQERVWKEFHTYVKSDRFIGDILKFFDDRHVDLQQGGYSVVSKRAGRRRGVMSKILGRDELSARFEFSMMDPDGGHIRPHTDAPGKIITLVFSILAPEQWNQDWGGGTQVCLPKDRTRIYNQVNNRMDFDAVDIVHSYPFNANQCILFIKTYNSWHQVAPISGPKEAPPRKTLTINIERLP